MAKPKVFVGSSTEQFGAARSFAAQLAEILSGRADLVPWTRSFELSATYIESLERATEDFDFAILFTAGEDVTSSRGGAFASPRDNVIFELGLFMGSLGRDRCFVVRPSLSSLKLPSDLLGVHVAQFEEGAAAWPSRECMSIADRIARLGHKPRVLRENLYVQSAIRRFCESLIGNWWERVDCDGQPIGLSFINVEDDVNANSVALLGRAYDPTGNFGATWGTRLARVEPDKREVLYYWEGWPTRSDKSSMTFHGFGEIRFDKARPEIGVVTSGRGRFWDIDSGSPIQTIVKSFQIRRVLNDETVRTMADGNEKAIGCLVTKTLNEW